MTRFLRFVTLSATFSACLALAQNTKPIPRMANGKPDLSGVWQSGGVSLYGEPGLSTIKLPPPVNPPPKRQRCPIRPGPKPRQNLHRGR